MSEQSDYQPPAERTVVEEGSCENSVTCFAKVCLSFCFFFQAEDGIRDLTVTGVQTCALPILTDLGFDVTQAASGNQALALLPEIGDDLVLILVDWNMPGISGLDFVRQVRCDPEIGRASCRERV